MKRRTLTLSAGRLPRPGGGYGNALALPQAERLRPADSVGHPRYARDFSNCGHHAIASGELSAGAVKARRPRADHARGRSEATSLARRRAQLETRWRDGRRARSAWSDGALASRTTRASARSRQMTGERRARNAVDDDTTETGDDDNGERQPGRERPSLESALGRSRAVKSEGRSRPGSLLRLSVP